MVSTHYVAVIISNILHNPTKTSMVIAILEIKTEAMNLYKLHSE